jgi:large subunit ribosomal protein L3
MNAILGEKLGMTQVFDEHARAFAVTVIKAGPCRVIQVKKPDSDGYTAVQLAYGEVKPSLVSKPESGHLAKAGAPPSRHLVEFRVDDAGPYRVGQEITIADVFEPGALADVTGISKGRGFQGVMVRHNFAGQGASHGNHKKHRAPGAIGACSTPARVFKGTRMAGRTGDDRVTTLNLRVVAIDPERHLLLLGGAVPGANGSLVMVREAVKRGRV